MQMIVRIGDAERRISQTGLKTLIALKRLGPSKPIALNLEGEALLEQLESYDLISRSPKGRWQLSDNGKALISRLKTA